MDRGST